MLKLSKLCNLRCVYCYEYEELGQRERMPLPGLGRFFESLAARYLKDRSTSAIRFTLHGGEPLLLPANYLRSLVALQEQHFGAHGIPYTNALQTNLYRIREGSLDLLEELRISLGVSLDVFGDQRVSGAGQDSTDRVLDNLQMLFDTGAARRLGVAAICVLHASNRDRAVETFRFFSELGLHYRILPIFSIADPPARMQSLMLSHEQVLETLKAVASAQFDSQDRPITVFPLWDYLEAAVHFLSGRSVPSYDARPMEWTLIVNTNGDIYNYSDAYVPELLLGNVFQQSLDTILVSEGRRRLHAAREERSRVCTSCTYHRACSHIPLVEALPSERVYGSRGQLRCAVAQPMIEFMMDQISQQPDAMRLVERISGSTARTPVALPAF